MFKTVLNSTTSHSAIAGKHTKVSAQIDVTNHFFVPANNSGVWKLAHRVSGVPWALMTCCYKLWIGSCAEQRFDLVNRIQAEWPSMQQPSSFNVTFPIEWFYILPLLYKSAKNHALHVLIEKVLWSIYRRFHLGSSNLTLRPFVEMTSSLAARMKAPPPH